MKAYLQKTRNPKKTKYIYFLFPDLRFGKIITHVYIISMKFGARHLENNP